jgi:hypothetical protein
VLVQVNCQYYDDENPEIKTMYLEKKSFNVAIASASSPLTSTFVSTNLSTISATWNKTYSI